MSDTRVKISSLSIPETVVYPGFQAKEFDLTRQEDQAFFLTEWPDITLSGADFLLVKTAGGCEEITVKFEERCGGVWIERHRGTFTDYDEKVNENQCWATVKPETVSDYQCLFDAWEKEVVVFGEQDYVPTSLVIGKYEHGNNTGVYCTSCYEGTPPNSPLCAVPANWCFDQNFDLGFSDTCTSIETLWASYFHRVMGIGTPTEPPPFGSGWIHISGNDWYRCPTALEVGIGSINYGKLFSDIVQNLFDATACGLTVRSHFFNIAATHDAPPDEAAVYYEYATAYLHHLTVHQKSDVKRPFADDPAEPNVWKMTAKKFLEDMWIMFQVQYKVVGSDLLLEHQSYFAAGEGLNVEADNLKLEYGKADAGAPASETFLWSDPKAEWSEDFGGFPITYDCGKGNKDRQVQLFSTEVFYINNIDNAEDVADANFVLIANEVLNDALFIINQNRPLGWKMLHPGLHKSYRFFEEGTMNDEPTSFDSVRRTRALEPFSVTLCCDDTFNEEQDIVTLIGPVSPAKVTINYGAGKDSRTLTINANI